MGRCSLRHSGLPPLAVRVALLSLDWPSVFRRGGCPGKSLPARLPDKTFHACCTGQRLPYCYLSWFRDFLMPAMALNVGCGLALAASPLESSPPKLPKSL